MTIRSDGCLEEPTTDELGQLCQDVFSSLTRSDQRRWAEVYVRGLTSVPGRKSIRRICESVVGWPAEQCLQQFVNQSPWDWEPVRRRLAQLLSYSMQPRAWAVAEIAFAKNGANSVGVARQYAGPLGRTLNCQLGLTVMLAGAEGSVPVNWRLRLPECWDTDRSRRTRSHVPDDERHRPRAQYLLEAVDEMASDWGLPATPVLLDGRHEQQLRPLLHALDGRGLGYLVRIAGRTPVPLAVPAARVPSADELVAQAARRNGTTVCWREGPDGRAVRSQYVLVALPGPVVQRVPGASRARGGPRRVLALWSPGARRAEAIWLTNLVESRLPELAELSWLARRTGRDLSNLADDCGLQHFEGRSFRGWHHHVTSVSVARAHRLLAERADEAMSPYAPVGTAV